MDMIYDWPTWVIVFVVCALMFLANELGYRGALSRRSHDTDRSYNVSNALKASILGLAALLIGFSYSITTSRYQVRQRTVLDEANSIGTCYLRAGLLKDPDSGRIRDILRKYTELRIEHFESALDDETYRRTKKDMDQQLDRLWLAVKDGVHANHELARTSQIVPAANEVIDQSSTRTWASNSRLPVSVLILLAVCMVISSGLMGHSSGQVARRHLELWVVLNLLVALVLFTILDFDRPRRGMIQIDHSPFRELYESMTIE